MLTLKCQNSILAKWLLGKEGDENQRCPLTCWCLQEPEIGNGVGGGIFSHNRETMADPQLGEPRSPPYLRLCLGEQHASLSSALQQLLPCAFCLSGFWSATRRVGYLSQSWPDGRRPRCLAEQPLDGLSEVSHTGSQCRRGLP